jgi:hypothetical protein
VLALLAPGLSTSEGRGGGIGAVATGSCSTASGFARDAFSLRELAVAAGVRSFAAGAALSAAGCDCSGSLR